MKCDVPKRAVLQQKQVPELRFANPHGVCQQSIENRLKLTGRTADNLQNVGGGGLLLERFAQLVKQPRILDGDYGLVSKIAHQLDLLFRE
jgi:hypothetical protein